MIERKTIYFKKPGRDNTAHCLGIVEAAIKDYAYKHVIVATTTGETGLMFSEKLDPAVCSLVVVTHSSGFKEPNTIEMPPGVRAQIESSGARVYTGSMLTHSLDTAFVKRFQGFSLTQVVAGALRRFGEGAKVCCECVMMAADAGLIPEGEEVLAVAGTARGADTVLVIKSAASKRFFELKVLEIMAKPRG